MPFLLSNIDRAIIATQFDLRGYLHPLGLRFSKYEGRKGISFIPCNLIAFAAGLGGEGKKPTDEQWKPNFDDSYETSLEVCRRLATACDAFAKEAIQFIIVEVIERNKEFHARIERGEDKPSGYVTPLEKGNWWGNVVLALAETFEVPVEQAVLDADAVRRALIDASVCKLEHS